MVVPYFACQLVGGTLGAAMAKVKYKNYLRFFFIFA